MVALTFLGGTREVGRSAVLLESSEKKLLLDYGVMLNDEPGFPAHIRASDLDGIILTHGHLDHTGAAPLFYLSGQIPVFGTPVTFGIAEVLIQDFIKLSSYFLPYEYLELENMMRSRLVTRYGEDTNLGSVQFRLLNAGHIPGSAMVSLEVEGKKILYTGDLNTVDTHLVRAAKAPKEEYDAVIIESTYANEAHPERKALEKQFVSRVIEIVNKSGIVLVPAFAVSRSQEILLILKQNGYRGQVAMDGMARKINEVFLSHPEYIHHPDNFQSYIDSANMVRGWRDRRRALRRPGAIIAPSGMLEGGTALHYMENVALNENNAVFLVSYQIPNSGGAKLLETGMFVIGGKEQEIKAEVARYDFSSHAGEPELKEFLRSLSGKPKIFTLHGAEENAKILADWASEELDLEAVAPEANEVFKI